MRFLFASESVTEGHPDKVCDQISDAIVDAYLRQDKNARVACETMLTANEVIITGEITSEIAKVDIPSVAKKVLIDIGYDNAASGFDANTCEIITYINKQSKDIALGVDSAMESSYDVTLTGAGDQGIMFGYACNDTPELMPMPIMLSHRLAKRLAEVRKDGTIPFLLPDGKTQVTVEYVEDTPTRVDTVVVSAHHLEDIPLGLLRKEIIEHVINAVIPKEMQDKDTTILINPTGKFTIGGSKGDSGLTGRKIIVDTYGGYARHGGGAFSGKDPTKVDRSASYMARYIAKNIVASKLAEKCEVQLAYVIGVANPASVMVDTFGTSGFTNEELANAVMRAFNLTPDNIIKELKLQEIKYQSLAAYGHMGRSMVLAPWEVLNKELDLLGSLWNLALEKGVVNSRDLLNK